MSIRARFSRRITFVGAVGAARNMERRQLDLGIPDRAETVQSSATLARR